MRTLVVGDIHGAHKALLQCFARASLDPRGDRLVVLGDVCDGYRDVRQCMDSLLEIHHCEMILGNHDAWALNWALRGEMPSIWTSQGGARTLESYEGAPMPQSHVEFLQCARLWLELDGRLFVHGGFDPRFPLAGQSADLLMWDRSLLAAARWHHMARKEQRFGAFEDIFLGHTTTEVYGSLTPLHFCNVWALDTGAGWSGRLTIMDVNTKEYWQSDPTPGLYGRKAR